MPISVMLEFVTGPYFVLTGFIFYHELTLNVFLSYVLIMFFTLFKRDAFIKL